MERMALPMTPQEIGRKYCGTWGVWQIRTFLIVSLVKVPTAWQMASITFTALVPEDFWCAPPTGLDLPVDVWRNISHPKVFDQKEGNEVYSPCSIYDVDYFSIRNENMTNLKWGSNVSTKPCLVYMYKSHHTIITKWHLVCNRAILASVSQFFYLFGIFVGGLIAVFCIPRFGPRNVILMAMLSQIATGIIIAYSPYLEMKILFRFLVGCSCSVMVSSAYVISTDLVYSDAARKVFSCCFEFFWSAGVITLAIWAYFLPNWTDLQLALSIPTVVLLALHRWIPNSTKWLLENERFEEARYELSRGAKLNGLEEPPKSLESYKIRSNLGEPCSFLNFYNENTFRRSFLIHVIWLCTIPVYFGALLNVKNLGSHVLFNTIIAGLAEILGALLGIMLISFCKHKWTYLAVIQLLGGAACVMGWAIPDDFEAWQKETIMVSLAMVGRVASSIALAFLQSTSFELWKPKYRQIASVSCITIARVLLLSAPFIGTLADYGDNVSLSAFGSLTFIGGIATILLVLDESYSKPMDIPS